MRELKLKLLFSLASEQDFFRLSEGYDYRHYRHLYRLLSEFRAGSVRDAAVRLVKAGMMDKIVRNRQPLFRLTSLGRDQLLKSLPRFKGQRKVWDRIWRIVIFKGVGRDARLAARRLISLGYKRVASGVYLTPLSVSEETKELILAKTWTKEAFVIASRRFIIGDDFELAKNLWDLDKKAQEYADFVSRAETLLKKSRRSLIALQQSKGGFKDVFDDYFRLNLTDPGLPKKLLPPDWQEEKAREVFLRLVELAKTAKI
ncbi:TPA: hypothetical protein DEB02_04250 [Candidatus Beckwithbacteria bacterium]|nr:hypothetical protein [Candidatus Beckwithbacteria bacterium]